MEVRAGRSPGRNSLRGCSEGLGFGAGSGPLVLFPRLGPGLSSGRTMAEAAGFIDGFDDLAVVGQPVEQRRGHLEVAEHAGPIGKRQIGRNHHSGVLLGELDRPARVCLAVIADAR